MLYYLKSLLISPVSVFLFPFGYKSKLFYALGNKKPGALSYTGLLVVDYRVEISNLELIRDINRIIKL